MILASLLEMEKGRHRYNQVSLTKSDTTAVLSVLAKPSKAVVGEQDDPNFAFPLPPPLQHRQKTEYTVCLIENKHTRCPPCEQRTCPQRITTAFSFKLLPLITPSKGFGRSLAKRGEVKRGLPFLNVSLPLFTIPPLFYPHTQRRGDLKIFAAVLE